MKTGHAGARSSAHAEQPWQRLEPASSWDELVLSEDRRQVLRAIPAELRARTQAAPKWRSESANAGLRILFVGGAGTGKTTAARILGAELGHEIIQVDLSAFFRD